MSTASIVRPRVFLDIQVGTEPAGRLVIELFIDKTPKTCENFRALCTSNSADKSLTYKLSPIHRIIDEFMIQGGDITKGDGTGGASIYGGEFEDENIGWREIDKEGLVCMANRGEGTNSSQFFITLAPTPHLNLKHTIFGHLVSGASVLTKLASLPVDKDDRPLTPVLVSHCGELERRKKAPILEPTTTTTTNPTDKTESQKSPTRGRKRQKRSHSPSLSPSYSETRSRKHHRKHHLSSSSRTPPKHRRRSEHDLDSTLRGRPRLRSSSPRKLPTISASKPHSPSAKNREFSPSSTSAAATTTKQDRTKKPHHHHRHHHHHKRHRSPSPSRSPSRNRSRSRSPHLRRRHSRSRSRHHRVAQRDRRGQHKQRNYHRHEEQEDEERTLRKEEIEREGGTSRFEDLIEEDRMDFIGSSSNRAGTKDNTSRQGKLNTSENRNGQDEGEGEGEVKFKGRGSMKFRERW